MDFLHFDNDDYETDDTFEKKYPWDPDIPKGWQYREGVNSKGKPGADTSHHHSTKTPNQSGSMPTGHTATPKN